MRVIVATTSTCSNMRRIPMVVVAVAAAMAGVTSGDDFARQLR